jgi:glyoxylase-like metal-dependent hydrolase (beta-lactamase superfamily II)
MISPIEGLSFPLPAPPRPGTTIEVSPGVHWLTTALPGRPRAINLWLLQDAGGWAMVDCGFPLAAAREQIEAVWSATLGKLPLTRLIVTHHHPDHVGNCRWVCDRWGIRPMMTESEHGLATIVMGPGWAEWSALRGAFWQRHGLPERTAAEFHRHRSHYRDLYAPLPESWEQIRDGEAISIGGCTWEIMVAQGHTPGQALLYSPQRRLLICGDQILPRTTPNVSVSGDPPTNPLALFLQSNERIARTCGEALVLPSHNLPFFGLHARIQALRRLRQERLAKIEDELKPEPVTAAALIPALFGNLYDAETGFAMGEVLAQLQYLVEQGRAERVTRDGKVYFTRAG